jgi:hypothetical protein
MTSDLNSVVFTKQKKIICATKPQELTKPNIISYIGELDDVSSVVLVLTNLLNKIALSHGIHFHAKGVITPRDGIIYDGNVIFSLKYNRYSDVSWDNNYVIPINTSFRSSSLVSQKYNVKDFYKLQGSYIRKHIIDDFLHKNNLYNISKTNLKISTHPFKFVKCQDTRIYQIDTMTLNGKYEVCEYECE